MLWKFAITSWLTVKFCYNLSVQVQFRVYRSKTQTVNDPYHSLAGNHWQWWLFHCTFLFSWLLFLVILHLYYRQLTIRNASSYRQSLNTKWGSFTLSWGQDSIKAWKVFHYWLVCHTSDLLETLECVQNSFVKKAVSKLEWNRDIPLKRLHNCPTWLPSLI